MKNETGIIGAIMNYLRLIENMGDGYFFRCNSFSGYIKRINGTTGFIKNNKPGLPDICGCYLGLFVGFEVKYATNKQSDFQRDAEKKIKDAAGNYFVVHDVTDVQNILDRMKALARGDS